MEKLPVSLLIGERANKESLQNVTTRSLHTNQKILAKYFHWAAFHDPAPASLV